MVVGTGEREDGDAVLVTLHEVVEAVLGRKVDALDEASVRRELEVTEEVVRRLGARQCRLTEALTRRQADRLRTSGRDAGRAVQRAARQVQRDLVDQLGWSPAQAKRAARAGRAAGDRPAVGAAMDAGRLPPGHAQRLADTLQSLAGADREEAEPRLLAAARDQDAVSFGRRCRRLLEALDHEATP